MPHTEKPAYRHAETGNEFITLHDCHAEKIRYQDDTLSFTFPNGFWVMPGHPSNESEQTARTDLAQVDFPHLDKHTSDVYLFRRIRNKMVVREAWALSDFIDAVNAGKLDIEFLYEYKNGYGLFLFKCLVYAHTKPHYDYFECELLLVSDTPVYRWNSLRYDHVW